MRSNGVRTLLMGGQACVFYGAAEFSRDTDLAVLADALNLERLARALAEHGSNRHCSRRKCTSDGGIGTTGFHSSQSWKGYAMRTEHC